MKVLIVDDDRVLADLASFTFRRAGYEVVQAHDTKDALRQWRAERPDVVILDVNLPGEPGLRNGFDVCLKIRQESTVPILMLTVRAEEDDVVFGLESGADDYLMKPFSPRQLIARTEAVLRRAGLHSADPAFYQAPGIEFNPGLRQINREGKKPLKLTALESRLLEYLLLHRGHIVTSQTVIDHVWGPGAGSSEMLRQLVRRLRAKLDQLGAGSQRIQNVPGLGYGFDIASE